MDYLIQSVRASVPVKETCGRGSTCTVLWDVQIWSLDERGKQGVIIGKSDETKSMESL